MSYVYPILTFVLGVVLGVWGNFYVVRPKLRVTGSGGGSDNRFATNQVTITNVPGFFGVRLEPTTIFGSRVHPRIEKGLTANRYPANECTAHLLDEDGNHITGLYWRSETSPGKFDNVVSIGPGESVHLMLFARLANEPLRYFIFQPAGADTNDPRVPPAEVRFTDSKKFRIRVIYSYGRQKLEVRAEMAKRYNGRLYYRVGTGGGSF